MNTVAQFDSMTSQSSSPLRAIFPEYAPLSEKEMAELKKMANQMRLMWLGGDGF